MRGNVIQIRVSDEEKAQIATRAKAAGLAVSEYIRRQVAPTFEEAQEHISKHAEKVSKPPVVTPQPPPAEWKDLPPLPTAAGLSEDRWRCKHRSCKYTSPTIGQCKTHLGTLVRVGRDDELI